MALTNCKCANFAVYFKCGGLLSIFVERVPFSEELWQNYVLLKHFHLPFVVLELVTMSLKQHVRLLP